MRSRELKKAFRGLIREHPIAYSFGLIAAVSAVGGEILVPRIIQWTTDSLTREPLPNFLRAASSAKQLQWLVSLFLVAMALRGLGKWMARSLYSRIAIRVDAQLKEKVWNTAQYLHPEEFSAKGMAGRVANLMCFDCREASQLFGGLLIFLIQLATTLTGSLVLMANMNMPLVLVYGVYIPFLARFLVEDATGLFKMRKSAQKSLDHLSQLGSAALGTIRVQKMLGASVFFVSKLIKASRRHSNARRRVLSHRLRVEFRANAIVVLCLFSVVVVAAHQILNEKMTVGTFLGFLGCVSLANSAMAELGVLLAQAEKARASFERVEAFIKLSPCSYFAGAQGVVVSDNVRGTPAHQLFKVDKLGFSDLRFSFEQKKGEKVAISSDIDCKISFVMSALAGLNPQYEGGCGFLGSEIRSWNYHSLRRRIGFLPKQSPIFSSSIRENVSPHIALEDQKIWEFLELVELAEEVSRFQRGLDAFCGEQGRLLSTGQKQRLAFARLLARNTEVLIVDDGLSAVDRITRKRVLTRISRSLKGKSVIWSGEDADVHSFCDRVITPIKVATTFPCVEIIG